MKGTGLKSGQALLARLEAHPELLVRVERLLDLSENKGGDVLRAADAEGRTIREIRALGQEVLQTWAKRLAEETDHARAGEIRDKKNGSTGKAALGK
jgi:hypothetical protein